MIKLSFGLCLDRYSLIEMVSTFNKNMREKRREKCVFYNAIFICKANAVILMVLLEKQLFLKGDSILGKK